MSKNIKLTIIAVLLLGGIAVLTACKSKEKETALQNTVKQRLESAEQYMKQGEKDKAIENFMLAIQEDESLRASKEKGAAGKYVPISEEKLLEIRKSLYKAHITKGDLQAAEKELKLAEELAGNYAEMKTLKGELYILQGKRFQEENKALEARQAFDKAVAADIKNPKVYEEIAEFYIKQAKEEAVLAFLEKGYEATSDKGLMEKYQSLLINRKGNSAGNLSNFGFAARQGDWIYHSMNAGDIGIYKTKSDGSEKTKINSDVSYHLNVIGEWIYYRNMSDQGKIYKIKTDGSSKAKITEDKGFYINVVGDWIYYQNQSAGCRLYKIKIDGTERKKLNDEYVAYVNVVGDWIYYQDENSGDVMYKLKTDGTGRTRVNNDTSIRINVIGEWAYYTNMSDGGRPYKIKTDGTSRTKLSDVPAYYLNVSGDWVYCADRNKKNLYKVKIDGTERVSLSNDSSWNMNEFNIIGEWIYYEDYSNNSLGIFKMKLDTSERTKLN